MSGTAHAQVTAAPAPAPASTPARVVLLQRKCACGGTPGPDGECVACRARRLGLQRLAAGGAAPTSAPPIVHEVLRAPGRPLDAATRAYMEPRFQHAFGRVALHAPAPAAPQRELTVGAPDDPHEAEAERVAAQVARAPEPGGQGADSLSFAGVRIHTGPAAARAAEAVQARAFTVGRDIVFGAGQYAPQSAAGRGLLAHELTHTLQQRAPGGVPRVRRLCDPTVLGARTTPVFFPHQTTIARVFAGTETLAAGSDRMAAIGLVQQALVDLCYDLGTTGPNHDGVDKDYEALTKQAVAKFQTDEAIAGAPAGVVDQATLKCLDEKRSHQTVPCPQVPAVAPGQYQVGGERTGGRDEDIFFARGSSTLDPDDKAKIARLATAHQGCALTLEGNVSEDELVDFGASLATDRLNAVDAEFAADGHDAAGVCTPPPPTAPPLRTLTPKPPAASAGVIAYRGRRKVEVIPPGAASATPVCSGPGAIPRHRALDATESPIVATAVGDGVALIDAARAHLVTGDAAGDAALGTFFGGVAQRTAVKGKLLTWRNHLDTVVRARNQRGTACDATCSASIAYNSGTGASAMMTVCDSFFGTVGGLYPTLTVAQRRALVLVHEAGHGALNTDDVAYDTGRLIHFIGTVPALALTNTDSFVTLIQCLAGLMAAGCPLPPRSDTFVGLGAAPPSPGTLSEQQQAQEGLAWLETWLTWAEQDVNGVYTTMNTSRTAGHWTNTYYGESVLDPLAAAFDLRRPRLALPTFREQTTVAAIWDRYLRMEAGAGRDLHIEKDTSATPVQRWEPGPGANLFLTDAYFALTTPRARVEALLPLIVEATPTVDAGLRPAYITFVKETVRLNWGNHP
ncbi:MAG TPA: DUF4157 domain-containing protein [Thermomicrobiales bacterium]|nr:DUF4157 domain-containing protein [Thermomicrobiales bacterium]